MIRISLEFAPGTSDTAKRLAQQLPAGAMLQAYRTAKRAFNTTDIVLVIADHDPEGFDAMPRSEYVQKALGKNTPQQLRVLPIANQTAHQRMKMPVLDNVESNAFWLVIESRENQASVMCAVGAVQFDVAGVS